MSSQAHIIRMHRGIFFDLYGTLLLYDDTGAGHADWMASLYESLQPYGLRMPLPHFESRVKGALDMPVPTARDDRLTVAERWLHRFCIRIGLVVPVDALRYITSEAVEAWQAYIRLDPDAVPVLDDLAASGKKLALITNFDHPPHVWKVLAETGLDAYFEKVVISGEVGVAKPDWRIFTPALEATGVRASETVHIGDADADVEGARVAGIMPIRIVRGAFSPEPGAPPIIASLTDLI